MQRSANPRAFPTPRSWQFVADVLAKTPPELLHRVVGGCDGDGPAAEFVAYLKLCRELPDPDRVLAQPTTSPVPWEPAVLYALVGALVEAVKRDGRLAGGFVTYAGRLPDEFALLAFRDAVAVQPTLVAHPAVQRWIATARGHGLFPTV